MRALNQTIALLLVVATACPVEAEESVTLPRCFVRTHRKTHPATGAVISEHRESVVDTSILAISRGKGEGDPSYTTIVFKTRPCRPTDNTLQETRAVPYSLREEMVRGLRKSLSLARERRTKREDGSVTVMEKDGVSMILTTRGDGIQWYLDLDIGIAKYSRLNADHISRLVAILDKL